MDEIIKQRKGKNNKAIIICSILAVLLLAIGLYYYNKKEDEKNWSDINEINEYGYIEAEYLTGPFVEEKLDSGVKNEYYLAMKGENIVGCILIKQSSSPEIPIVTSDEEYNNAISQGTKRMKGYSKDFDKEVKKVFIEGLNEYLETNQIDDSKLSDITGKYYLDTTASNDNKVFGGVFIFLGVILIACISISLIKGGKEYKNIKNQVERLKQDGIYDTYENDIKSSNSYTENKYVTVVANDNIYNFEKNVLAIPIEKIINVYKCSIENGQISKNDYICIETNDNNIYSIAFKPRGLKDLKFDKLLNQIKQRMVR